MKIQLPVIGIPPWPWKRAMIEYARNHSRPVEVVNKDLDYECHRHYEMLRFLVEYKGDWSDLEYVRFLKSVGRNTAEIIKAVHNFYALYTSIKSKGLLSDSLPMITADGVRLNGSHRIVIAVHLGIKRIKVNLVKYTDVFTAEEILKIQRQVQECRQRKFSPGYLASHRY